MSQYRILEPFVLTGPNEEPPPPQYGGNFQRAPHPGFRGLRHPGCKLEVNWDNPLTRGLSALIVATPSGDLVDIVNNRTFKTNGGSRWRDKQGPSTNFDIGEEATFPSLSNYDVRGAHTHFILADIDAYSNFTAFIANQSTTTTNGWEIRGGSASTDSRFLYLRADGSGFRAHRWSSHTSPTGLNTFGIRCIDNLCTSTPEFTNNDSWVHGVQLYSGSATGTIGNSTQDVYIAGRYDSSTNLNGRFHMWAFWNNRRISDQELKLLHESPYLLTRPAEPVYIINGTPNGAYSSPATLTGSASFNPSLYFPPVQLAIPKAWLDAPGLYYNTLQYVNPLDVEINWDHPLTKDLAVYFFPGNPYNLVDGKPLTLQGTGLLCRIHGNVAGRPAFVMSDVNADERIEADVTDDPYFNGNFSRSGLSMAAHWWLEDGDANGNVIGLNQDAAYYNWHLTAAANNASDPFYGQFVSNGSFSYTANLQTAGRDYYSVGGPRWNYCGGSVKSSNYCLTVSNQHSVVDASGSTPSVQWDNIGLGARKFGASYVNSLGGGIAWGGVWRRALDLGDHWMLRTNPYQILKVKK